MEYTKLGHSGLLISKIVLGCMSFGDSRKGTHEWSMGIDEAKLFFRRAIEAGVTTFDTANVYSLGSSEEFTGQLLREFSVREDVIIATKVGMSMGSGPKDAGLSRAAIFAQVDASLRRLGIDYVDLYQIHRFDPRVRVEETMGALHDLVRAGKVRYLGASSMFAWQFAKMQAAAEKNGWTLFVSMQDQYNLLMREDEPEMHPLCVDQGIGVLPWSPLARGRLTREWGTQTERETTDRFGQTLYHQQEDSDRAIIEAVGQVAEERGASRAQVALAWVLSKPAVTAPIVGVTKLQHLDDAIVAADLELSPAEVARLEAPYTPRRPEGF